MGEGTADPRWTRLRDQLLRGIAHELNNRVGAVRAVAQVMAGDPHAVSSLTAALVAEGDRLQRTVDLLRLLPDRLDEPEEPLQLHEVLEELSQLLPLHPDLFDLRVSVERVGDPVPVRANRARVLQTLAIAAVEAAGSDPAGLRVHVETRGDETVARFEGGWEVACRHMLA